MPEGTSVCEYCGADGGDGEPTIIYLPVSPNQHPSLTPDEAAHIDGVKGFALVVKLLDLFLEVRYSSPLALRLGEAILIGGDLAPQTI